ncbi:hypothetical protein GLYMA_19G264100v4 [Glycine max]|uniref:Uncharacterized protein n=2 Tax=Glycine subgen. Soja TaxID=1462606 RepID=A0A0R0EU62_SOYBN|nr:hypothetical protein GYH30_057042 [Glycine max]KRG97312.1 hypothetical protein GLYMA_19G264100v4 [Glycine max]RZB64504.1 hypothetical protein D0Y65_040836 [Glycine soja]
MCMMAILKRKFDFKFIRISPQISEITNCPSHGRALNALTHRKPSFCDLPPFSS